MKRIAMLVVSLAALAAFAQPSRADDMHKHCDQMHAGHQHGGMPSGKMGDQDGAMQDSIAKMQDQIEAAAQANEPEERLRLLQRHNESMREGIKIMREMMAGGMGGTKDGCDMMHGNAASGSSAPGPIAPSGKAAKSAKSSKSGAASKSSAKQLWTCPMHPNVVQDHAGVCPVCGMDLVKMDARGGAKSGHDHKMGCMSGGAMGGNCKQGGCMQGGGMMGGCMQGSGMMGGCMQGGGMMGGSGMMGKHMDMMLTLMEQFIEHNEVEMKFLK